jgi:nicotinamide-nucleotide amidase
LLDPTRGDHAFALVKDDVRIYFLPNDRLKLAELLKRYVLTELRDGRRPLPAQEKRVLKLYGLEESQIAARIEDLARKRDDIFVELFPAHPAYHVCICCIKPATDAVKRDLERLEQEICARLRPFIFAAGNQTMAGVLGERLREKSLTLAVAESCTGGLIGHLLTAVPGSSDYFMGGVVVYSNRAKVDLLQVAKETIDAHGAVSAAAVRQMAEGVKGRFQTDMGLAVTGIAGPGGGSVEKPVGTVHIGLALHHETYFERYRFKGSREQIKSHTAMMAMDWIRRILNGHPFIPGV